MLTILIISVYFVCLLGLPRLEAFRRRIAAIREEDWTKAATQMLDSKTAFQTGGRYQRLAQAFETDVEKHLDLRELYDQSSVREGGLTDFSDAELLEELSRHLLSI